MRKGIILTSVAAVGCLAPITGWLAHYGVYAADDNGPFGLLFAVSWAAFFFAVFFGALKFYPEDEK